MQLAEVEGMVDWQFWRCNRVLRGLFLEHWSPHKYMLPDRRVWRINRLLRDRWSNTTTEVINMHLVTNEPSHISFFRTLQLLFSLPFNTIVHCSSPIDFLLFCPTLIRSPFLYTILVKISRLPSLFLVFIFMIHSFPHLFFPHKWNTHIFPYD